MNQDESKFFRDTVIAIIDNALGATPIYNHSALVDILNKKMETEQDLTMNKILNLTESIITFYYDLTTTALNILTVYSMDIMSYGIIKEQAMIDNNDEPSEENPVFNPKDEILSELYKTFTFKDSVDKLNKNGYSALTDVVLNKYKDKLEEIDSICNPYIDLCLTQDTIKTWTDTKFKYYEDKIMGVLFQHHMILELLNKYPDLTLTMDQLKEMFLESLKGKLTINLQDAEK